MSAPPPYSEQDHASAEAYPLVKDNPVTGGYQSTQGYPPDAPQQVSCFIYNIIIIEAMVVIMTVNS